MKRITSMAAAEGAYGAPSYDRTAHHAKALTRAVELYMPDAAFFTRDDLMYLPTFSSLALVTRYYYVCQAVTYAVERGWMLPVSRTQLVLSGKKRQYLGASKQTEQFRNTVLNLLPARGSFSFTATLDAWQTDTHLSQSAKRTIVRETFKTLMREGIITRLDVDEFARKED